MSQLIQMRHRIKAIETIKKITHAMRLISMSSHAHLKNQHVSFDAYITRLKSVLAIINTHKTPPKSDEAPDALNNSILICVIGSQKGLCGTFNTMLMHYFNRHIHDYPKQEASLFVVGKKIIDTIPAQYRSHIIGTESNLSPTTALPLTKKIQTIMAPFKKVIFISNHMKSFFVQEPHTTHLLPLEEQNSQESHDIKDEFLWEVAPQDILDTLVPQYLEAHIQHILLQSLLSEHAARFIAMDNATRNARNLLEEKKLEYNKLRQAKITKELTELSGIFNI